jgi:hypothetical protein
MDEDLRNIVMELIETLEQYAIEDTISGLNGSGIYSEPEERIKPIISKAKLYMKNR